MRPLAARPGFALLLTLILVVMVGIALAGLARWSMLGAAEAQNVTEEMQRRWTITSCQATLLQRVDLNLERAEHAQGKHRQPSDISAELRINCQLSGLKIQLVLTDEQAKLNANRWPEKSKVDSLQAALKQVLPQMQTDDAQSKATVRARPLVQSNDASGGVALPRFGSYGQLFNQATPRELLGTTQGSGLAAAVTCWGDGRVNIHRATAAVIQQVCADALSRSQIAAFIRVRNDNPDLKLAELLERQAFLDDKQTSRLQEFFTDESRCCGLWIVVQGTQRSWYALAIGEGGKRTREAASVVAPENALRENHVEQQHDFNW